MGNHRACSCLGCRGTAMGDGGLAKAPRAKLTPNSSLISALSLPLSSIGCSFPNKTIRWHLITLHLKVLRNDIKHASFSNPLHYLIEELERIWISGSRERQRIDQNRRTTDLNVAAMGQNLRTAEWNVTTMGRGLSDVFDSLTSDYDWIPLEWRIGDALRMIQYIYYPILAIFGVPVNLLTIGILSRGKCGLSKCVTRYLVAMAAADLLVIILDLILRHIPIVYQEQFQFLLSISVCNIHAILLYAATDCSVWFTVSFTFDLFVAICCYKLKCKYCSEKTAAVVLGTVTVLSCLKNIFWYFMLKGQYFLRNIPWFCEVTDDVMFSRVWTAIEFLQNILTPGIPFMLILLLNTLTVRHILVSSRGRRRLRAHNRGESHRDPEMENRRKSIILLFVISGNFILLWAVLIVWSTWKRMRDMGYVFVFLPAFLRELGFMLQLLSCCTNTMIYAVTQTHFRQQLKNVLKYPFTATVKCIQR
ncbi:probable G-protein coupled receptor 139 [Heterodontus francisci]|uniref:probable G-protein coupled receptor 139 n=1 Tax=Heterodontus francisci TaxID=7792 RepID=UPI00355BB745